VDTQTTTAPAVLSNAVTNAEIRDFFEHSAAFQAGKAVLANIEVKGSVVRTMFVQNRIDLPVTTNTNPLLAMAMKWDNNIGRTIRAWQNFDPSLFEALQKEGVSIGSTGEEVFAKLAEITKTPIDFKTVKIAVVEDNTPDVWANEHGEEVLQKPLTTSKGVMLTSKGLAIYQHTELCFDDTVQDVLLPADRIVTLRQS